MYTSLCATTHTPTSHAYAMHVSVPRCSNRRTKRIKTQKLFIKLKYFLSQFLLRQNLPCQKNFLLKLNFRKNLSFVNLTNNKCDKMLPDRFSFAYSSFVRRGKSDRRTHLLLRRIIQLEAIPLVEA